MTEPEAYSILALVFLAILGAFEVMREFRRERYTLREKTVIVLLLVTVFAALALDKFTLNSYLRAEYIAYAAVVCCVLFFLRKKPLN